jgi:hypothetical protein
MGQMFKLTEAIEQKSKGAKLATARPAESCEISII